MKHIKPEEVKAFLLGLGLSALFMATSLLASGVRQSEGKQHDNVLKSVDGKQIAEHYSEILGMN